MTASGAEPGFETDLDFSDLDTMSAEEAQALLRWYVESHGEGNLDLVRFVPFLIEHRPGALKRYRRYVQTLHEEGGLPQITPALLYLHHYMIVGNERGAFYEVIAAREWGATKAEVLDVIQLAFLSCGPYGVNAVAEHSDAYLRAWPDDAARAVAEPWPAEWSTHGAGPAAATEVPPPHVTFLGRHAPEMLRGLRVRYEQPLRALPLQIVPLLRLHSATALSRPAAAGAAAAQARAAGVTKRQALEAMGFAFLYATEASMDAVTAAVSPVFEDWR